MIPHHRSVDYTDQVRFQGRADKAKEFLIKLHGVLSLDLLAALAFIHHVYIGV
jgi:hypothetical protein